MGRGYTGALYSLYDALVSMLRYSMTVRLGSMLVVAIGFLFAALKLT